MYTGDSLALVYILLNKILEVFYNQVALSINGVSINILFYSFNDNNDKL